MNPRLATTILVAGASLFAASPILIEHLQKWESSGTRVLTVYADTLADGLPTVCNGLTKHITKMPIIVGQRWTEEQCFVEESFAIAKVQASLARCFKRPPTQFVFDMATSHAWNFGVSATCGSAAMAAWNRGDWEIGCRRLATSDEGRPVWSSACTGSGVNRQCKFVRGLANRRADEAEKCRRIAWWTVTAGVVTTAPTRATP